MVALLASFALLSSAVAFASVDMLVPGFMQRGSARQCGVFFLHEYLDRGFRANSSGDNHLPQMIESRAKIEQAYGELGVVPASEMAHLFDDEEHFPAQAMLYLRSVNERTGRLEGLLRIVSGTMPTELYYAHVGTARYDTLPAITPIEVKYPDPAFRAWFRSRFPNPLEMGRAAFASGVPEVRVLLDLTTVALRLSWFPRAEGYPAATRWLVAEAVRPAVRRYEAMGLTIVPDVPIRLHDDRVLMAAPLGEVYRRYLGRFSEAWRSYYAHPDHDTTARRAALGEFDAAIAGVSDTRAVRDLHLLGFHERALAHFEAGNFLAMRDDMNHVARYDSDGRETRLLQLYAEVGSRFAFYKDFGGDLAEARRFLAAPATQERYADERLRAHVYPFQLLFLRGLVSLAAKDYRDVRAARDEIELQLRRRSALAHAANPRWKSWVMPPEVYAERCVSGWRETAYDPATGVGDAALGFELMDSNEFESPFGITAAYHRYRADLMARLGRQEEAAHSRAAAAELSIMPPGYKVAITDHPWAPLDWFLDPNAPPSP